MIDELAKAIWATREARFPAYTRRNPDYLDEATGAFQNCREEALAVLRRMREPTPDEILKAGGEKLMAAGVHHGWFPKFDLSKDPIGENEFLAIVETLYRAMIDAAIGEKHEHRQSDNR